MSALGMFSTQLHGKLAVLRNDLTAHAALQTAGVHGSTVGATANKLIHRDAAGRAQVADPAVDADIATRGWVNSAISSAGGGTVTSVGAGTGLVSSVSGGVPITTSGSLSLGNTAVTAGSYTLANITVDAQGRLTSASNGSAVTSIGISSPITKTGTTAPTLGIQAATSSQHGYMSSTDKAKLDGIASGAQVNAVPSVFGRTGAVTANTGDYTIQKIGGFTVSTAGPSGGANGDVWIQV